ncbi:hypothetical protein MACK_003978 [Theileria orientalis]|uniref:Uncharacterized protein n=1 Tax=Theileria orientalis TaxID=68886 RepID=A0A976SJL8_THEOR|nr:hypothetical protein MACK_003978 [Theileria orientalis]
MLDGLLGKENKKKHLEKRSFENLVICNSLALSNLPIKGECILDLSKDGEYILASNKSNICLAHTLSHLYNPLLRHKHNPNTCCCDSYSIKYTPPRSNIVKKALKYKTRCTSSLWYCNDNSIFLTAGDSSIDVWDSSTPEIAYSFSNLPSLVKYLCVSNSSSSSPTIAGGLSCGTISLCDTRYGTSTNFCKPRFSASVSVMKFLKHNDNQLIAGYENSSVLVWDLRRFNRPLYTISNREHSKTDSIIWGCSFNSGPLASKLIRENHSFDFKTEDEVWNYIKSHESGTEKSTNTGFEENKFLHSGRGRGRGRGNSRKRPLDLSSHTPKACIIFTIKLYFRAFHRKWILEQLDLNPTLAM